VDPVPPAEIDARVLRVALRSAHVSLVDYLKETNQPTTGLSKFDGAEKGYVFTVRVRLQGHQGELLPLRWTVVDTKTLEHLSGPTYNQTAVKFKPQGQDHARTWPIWVPAPDRRGTFFLRTTLVDEKRQPLDEADSQPFTLRRAPPP
jgi:hypothetical protein